jgi:murein DD-endopeptidase MepM/ murein hydrolase activator NlpD
MGNTGLSTSYHLHYGVIVNGRAVDPMQYILDTNRS